MARKVNNINKRVICTTPASTPISIPHVSIPVDIRFALKNQLKDHDLLKENCRKYIKFIKSLSKLQKIERQHYLVILQICLYLEQYETDVRMSEYSLKNHKIKKKFDYFIIYVPFLKHNNRALKFITHIIIIDIDTKERFLAKILGEDKCNVTVHVYSKNVKNIEDSQKFDIYFKTESWPIRCCHYALSRIHKYDLVEMLYPQLKLDCMQLDYDIKWINTNISKNKQQQQAIINTLKRSAHPAPYILFGPPGTGKTQTLVEIICQIVKHYPTKNILVCTSSNSAADEITKRLVKYISHDIVIRLYAPSKELEDVCQEVVPYSNFFSNNKSNYINLHMPKEVLLLKKVVISTLTTSIRLSAMTFRVNHFSYIIIDEGSQAIEPEMLIPFILTSGEDEDYKAKLHAQIVVAGDPYQLGPYIRNKHIEHILGKSMLERLMNECEPYKKQDGEYNPRYITKLLKNYRNHKHILHVSNEEFYDNELEAYGVHTEIALNWSKLPQKGFPIIFHEHFGNEQRTESHSVYNTTEMSVVMEYVKILVGAKFENHIIKEKDIGIITFFKEQQLRLMNKLKAINLKNVTVGTVELFQGQERTVTIISTVRSKMFEHDDVKHIGFLSNPKRFNVALTRAKALMIVIGNPNIICIDKYWKKFWEYCKANGAIKHDKDILKV